MAPIISPPVGIKPSPITLVPPAVVPRAYLDPVSTIMPSTIDMPADTANSFWILNVSISSVGPSQPFRITANICPMSSSTGQMYPWLARGITIPSADDIIAAENPAWGPALQAIYVAVLEFITAHALLSTPNAVQSVK